MIGLIIYKANQQGASKGKNYIQSKEEEIEVESKIDKDFSCKLLLQVKKIVIVFDNSKTGLLESLYVYQCYMILVKSEVTWPPLSFLVIFKLCYSVHKLSFNYH